MYLVVLNGTLTVYQLPSLSTVRFFFLLSYSLVNFFYLSKPTSRQSHSLIPRSARLSLSLMWTSPRGISVCMLSNVCFNVLTYATPYKQRSMQTVARLPSDKPSGAGEGECPVTGRRGAGGDQRGNVGNEPEKSLPRKCLFGTFGNGLVVEKKITFAWGNWFLFYLFEHFSPKLCDLFKYLSRKWTTTIQNTEVLLEFLCF